METLTQSSISRMSPFTPSSIYQPAPKLFQQCSCCFSLNATHYFHLFFFLFSFPHPSQEKERRYLKFQGVENRSLLLPLIFCFACECKIGLRREQGRRYTPGVSVPIAGRSKQERQITQGRFLPRHMTRRTFLPSQPRLCQSLKTLPQSSLFNKSQLCQVAVYLNYILRSLEEQQELKIHGRDLFKNIISQLPVKTNSANEFPGRDHQGLSLQ